jgi:hypothetical protein
MTATNHRWLALLIALLAVTAGCTGAGGGGDSSDGHMSGSSVEFEGEDATRMATGTPVAESTVGDGGDAGAGGDASGAVGDYNAQQFVGRKLILTGHVAIEIDDFDTERSDLTRTTQRYGGFVSDTRQEVHRVDNETWTEGLVVLRVPRENFTAVFETAQAEGELVNAERNSQDVTDQLVDIRARLDNLRAERDQLRELYQRANDTEDVLRVQERLSDVQGEIERLEARQQSLRERVALSTITVRLAEPRPEPDRPVPDRWYDIPLVAAFFESVDGVVVTLRAIAVAGAYALPYLFAFGLPLAVAGYVVRRKRGRRPGGRLRGWLARRRGDEPAESAPPTESIDGVDEDAPDDEAE